MKFPKTPSITAIVGSVGLAIGGVLIFTVPGFSQQHGAGHTGGGCGSYNRSGQAHCGPLVVPPEAHTHSAERLSRRAERRDERRAEWQARHAQRHPVADTEAALRDLVDTAGGEQGAAAFLLPSNDLASIPQDPLNPLTPEKVDLGKLLYHETGLALNPVDPADMGTYSCASCHFAEAGFTSGLNQGISEGGMGFGPAGSLRVALPDVDMARIDVQPIAVPSILNTAYQNITLWNGQFGATGANTGTDYAWTEGTPKAVNRLGYEGVETQAIAGLAVPRLLDDTAPETTAASLLTQTPTYVDLFARAFPDEPLETRVRQETAGLAIAAYERTLVADQAPFQDWLRGDSTALTESQKRGAAVFFGDGQCVQCHSGPSLAGMEFYALGLNDLDSAPGAIIKDAAFPEVFGRGAFTGLEADMFTFKVPRLYNLADQVDFGHGANFDTVRAMIDYKNAAIAENPRVPETALAAGFHPLDLTEADIEALTDFLENGLRDDALGRYVPATLPSGQCFPDNDRVAQQDSNLNCPQ